jgi:hypothetical protein
MEMDKIAESRRDLIELERKLESMGRTFNNEMRHELEELKKQQSSIENNYEEKRKETHRGWLKWFSCNSVEEMYKSLEHISKDLMGLDDVPFSLQEVEHPINNVELHQFMSKCYRYNRYEYYKQAFQCKSLQQLYVIIERIAKDKMSLDKLPFTLEELENPESHNPDIDAFILQCEGTVAGKSADVEAKVLIDFLKKNPPKVSYKNPKLSLCRLEDSNLIEHIFDDGIDLPGARFNNFGHLQYFSSFFIDIFFGNLTEVMEHIKSLTDKELKKALERREGYCQYTPVFAPILGLRLVNLEASHKYTSIQKKEIRTMYSGNNENLHVEILQKLLELGADPNPHDINGFTPLHYAVNYSSNAKMTKLLLENGANPNKKSKLKDTPMSRLTRNLNTTDTEFKMIEMLVEHGTKVENKLHGLSLRVYIEQHGSKELAVKVREAYPR